MSKLDEMRAGASFGRDTPELLELAKRGLCTRQVLAGAPDDPLYYIAHTCGHCKAVTIGRPQDEPLCERCATLRSDLRTNALGVRPSVFNIGPDKEAPGHG